MKMPLPLRCLLPFSTLLALSLASSNGSANPLKKQIQRTDIIPNQVVHWAVVSQEIASDRSSFEVGLHLSTLDSFTVYKKHLKFSGPAGFAVASLKTPESRQIQDPMDGGSVEVFSEGAFFVTFAGLKPLQAASTEITVEYTSCTEVICLFPYKQRLAIDFAFISPSEAESKRPYTTNAPHLTLDKASPKESKSSVPWYKSLERWILDVFSQDDTPLAVVLAFIFLGGLLSNLTPCVYPMIPITIRILGNTGHSLLYSYLYGTGIVVTYTSLGVFAGLTGSMFGKFMQSPYVNLGFAILMMVLALGMLGFASFQALQSIGTRFGAGQLSARNTFMMGIGAGLVAAPCTGPIMIALLGYAAKTGDFFQSVSIFLVYSTGFALPYVLLGAGAAKLGQRRFGYHVQLGVKLLFAAVMFALAFYYLRIPLYSPLKALDGLWEELSMGLVIAGLISTTAVLLIKRWGQNKAAGIIPTLILGMGVFATYKAATAERSELRWHKSEASAFAAAQSQNRPILIDGWAEWCIACVEMDQNTFRNPQVIEELNRYWVLLKLDLTESTEQNDQLIEKYSFAGLPSFALLNSSEAIEEGTVEILVGKQEPDEMLDALHSFRAERNR